MGLIADSDHRKKGGAALGSAHGDPPATGWAAWIGVGGGPGLGHKARSGKNAVRGLAGSGADWLAAPDSYWRRRFFLLAGGLAFLGVITWGVSALLGPAKPIGGTRPARVPASEGKAAPRSALAASEAARAGSVAPAAAPPGATLPGAASPAATLPAAAYGPPVTTPPASPALAAAPASAPGASASGAPAGGQCQPSGIVLSLLTSKPQYGPREQPQFTVYIVSTAPSPCHVAYTPPFTHVIVTRSGQVVWDSTACADGGGAAGTAQFTPGVPMVVTLSWNRKAASQACAGTLPAGATGPLAAVAMADGKSSPIHWFSLTG